MSAQQEPVKTALFFILFHSGLESVFTRRLSGRAAAILMYHGIAAPGAMPREVEFNLPARLFRRHVRMLRRRYRLVPLSTLVAMLRGEDVGGSLAITFDDGYRHNLTAGLPALEGAPATMFLATGYIGSDRWLPLNRLYALWRAGKLSAADTARLRRFFRSLPLKATAAALDPLEFPTTGEERRLGAGAYDMLAWDEVREMAERGIEFGSHTEHHINLRAEDALTRRRELEHSRRQVEPGTHNGAVAFAYPAEFGTKNPGRTSSTPGTGAP